MKQKLVILVGGILFFIVVYAFFFVTGLGILFEDSDPIKAMCIFSLMFAIVFEMINYMDIKGRAKIKELEKRIEELEKKQD